MRRTALPAAVIAALAVGSLAARSDAAGSDALGRLVDRFRQAGDETARAAAREAILKKDPDPEKLLDAIRKKTAFSNEAPRGIQTVDLPGAAKPLELYVPEKYDARKSWPVLVALHGTGGDGKSMVDRAAPECRERGWILAAPSQEKSDIASAIAKASTTGFGWGDHRENLALLALDWVSRHYRVDTNRVYLMGVSQGGYGAWGIGTCYPQRWAAVLPYAGGIDHRENFGGLDLIQKIPAGYRPGGLGDVAGGGRRRDLLKNVINVPFFFVHGSKDDVVKPEGDRKSAEELHALGYKNWRYVEKDGWGHVPKDPKQIAALVDELLAWADERERDPHPEQIVHFSPRKDTGQAWWIRLDDFEEGAEVEAVRRRNVIQISARQVKKLTVLLGEGVVDLDKKVKIAVNGKPVFAGKVKPTAEQVLDSYAQTWDPERTYPASVTITVP